MHIKEMQQAAYDISHSRGFHGLGELNIPTKLMLIVSELSEALEEHREDKALVYFKEDSLKPEGLAIELADAVIRIGDLAGILGFDLEAAVIQKMEYNKTRPHKHGNKRY